MKRKEYLPYCQISFDQSEIREVTKCLESGWLTMGSKVIEFEKEFAKYVGAKYALSVSSATAGLHLSLLAHGIGKGDEVLVPSFTFVSTVNVIIHVGATPVFVDIDRKTFNMDPEDLQKKVTSKSKAIIPVHYAGLPADLGQIAKIAKKNKLVVIEDAAHAVGSKYHNKLIGASGNTTCFSFYATKTMTTGEGGMVTTNNSKIANYIMRNRLHGISKDAWKRYSKSGTWKYDVLQPGYKCNMTDIQAAMGIQQLKKLEGFVQKREQYSLLYTQGFAVNTRIETLETPEKIRHSHHLFPILLKDFDREEFIEEMTKYNIGTSVHFIPVHQFTYYKKFFPIKKSDLKVTNEIAKKIVSLPLYPSMSESDVQYVIETVNKITASKN